MNKNDLIEDTLYNTVNTKIYSLLPNEIEVQEQESFTDSEWCPKNFSSPIEGMASVAGFSPEAFKDLPARQACVPERFMKFYSKPLKSNSLPEVIPAIHAIQVDAVQAGVDYRPHLWDAASKKHLLLDSGSAVTAFPRNLAMLSAPA